MTDYIFITLSQSRDKRSFHLILTLLSIKANAKAEFLALTSTKPLARVLNVAAGIHLYFVFALFCFCFFPVSPPIAMIRSPGKRNFRNEGFILA